MPQPGLQSWGAWQQTKITVTLHAAQLCNPSVGVQISTDLTAQGSHFTLELHRASRYLPLLLQMLTFTLLW